MSVCQGCGTPVEKPRSGRRKWCSEKCRKDTLYGGTCVDCGARTNGSDGRGPNASERCPDCSQRRLTSARAAVSMVREREVAALYREGLAAWQIAERLDLTAPSVANLAVRARKHGLDCPYAPTGGLAHRDRVAA